MLQPDAGRHPVERRCRGDQIEGLRPKRRLFEGADFDREPPIRELLPEKRRQFRTELDGGDRCPAVEQPPRRLPGPGPDLEYGTARPETAHILQQLVHPLRISGPPRVVSGGIRREQAAPSQLQVGGVVHAGSLAPRPSR